MTVKCAGIKCRLCQEEILQDVSLYLQTCCTFVRSKVPRQREFHTPVGTSGKGMKSTLKSMRLYPWGKWYLCSPDCSMEADINCLMGSSCCIYMHAGGFAAGTVDSCSLKTTTEVIKPEMMLTVSSECRQVTLIHYKAVYGPLYSVAMYNNPHGLHVLAATETPCWYQGHSWSHHPTHHPAGWQTRHCLRTSAAAKDSWGDWINAGELLLWQGHEIFLYCINITSLPFKLELAIVHKLLDEETQHFASWASGFAFVAL